MRRFIAFVSILYCSLTHGQVSKIVVWESLYNNPTTIMMDYLNRSLQVTQAEYGDYELIASAKMEQGRSLIEIAQAENSKLDIASYAPTKEREKLAIPIRIPALNGLMGYRLCLIKDGSQIRFDDITSQQQLVDKKITIGQHQDWPDTSILRANDIVVKTTYKKKLLFQQLSRGRFDCFSRGANEIYEEYLAHKAEGISIEENLLLYYPLPIFFFVNKSQPQLAERVQLGLEKLIASGEYDLIFERFFSKTNAQLKLSERTVIDLYNPTLSEETIRAIQTPTLRFRDKNLKTKEPLAVMQD
ncbi:transporter substrate-binding domain-containing protein [Psychromonas antarctica]|uniref:transporter substrate-binding domain-containing protein n=1 Tax=Psychromonas antarctica TaxID=67573 RepID=UPI001EE8087B|nr:transporter substrate-binding domain-containing protein [Psychromonas antarctica]MCG6201939.1 transporter substrate-binding domain-containing protein [Psychromonas antarctica]